MSGTSAVTNTFASAVTATGAQLDTNYTDLTNYNNDPTNRNNFAVDAGITNTVILTMSPPVIGYTTGLELSFKAANTNSGAMVINVNGLGNKSFVDSSGLSIPSASVKIGGVYDAVYDGTVFVGIGLGNVGVPSAKAWGSITATYGIQASYNLLSVGTAGTGTVTIYFATAFSNTSYVALCTPLVSSNFTTAISSRTTTSCVVILRISTTGGAVDSDFGFVAYGV